MSIHSNEARCTSCHVGYGWEDDSFDFTDMNNIDCLVCHDTTGEYEKIPTGAGMPDPDVDLVHVAENVGRTSRSTCGGCHFSGGGGDAVKHADMSRELYYPQRSCDIHMGGYDFQCRECHKSRDHKISGRSSSVPAVELGPVSCMDCHTKDPHKKDQLLAHHLNEHCEPLDCNTCHSPVYSKCASTKTLWDWSQAGDKDREPEEDKYGNPLYSWNKGAFEFQESVKPVYRWFNGYTERVLLGDKVDLDSTINITTPLGSFKDPESKIAPFKQMRGIQAADQEHEYLLVPHLFPRGEDDDSAYWKHTDWQKSFAAGMEAVDLPYSGEYQWVQTKMYWNLNHEVMPADMALSCTQCHESLTEERTCDRCHQDGREQDFEEYRQKGTDFEHMAAQGRDVEHLIGTTDYIDFKALGYAGDPIIHGGRFQQLPLKLPVKEKEQ
ncbi:MAG: tetrathionate reductase family octaheme c-type cytochrome [Desulfohalobiaceae bacterium]